MSGDVAVAQRAVLGMLGVLLAAACANAPSTAAQEEANVAAARRAIEEAWNNRNFAALSEVYAPDVATYSNGVRDTLSAEAFIQATLQTYPDARVEVVDVFGTGDRVVMHWTWTATAVPATTTATVHGATISRFVNGKIVESHDFYDLLAFTAASGATITPAAAPAAPATTPTPPTTSQ